MDRKLIDKMFRGKPRKNPKLGGNGHVSTPIPDGRVAKKAAAGSASAWTKKEPSSMSANPQDKPILLARDLLMAVIVDQARVEQNPLSYLEQRFIGDAPQNTPERRADVKAFRDQYDERVYEVRIVRLFKAARAAHPEMLSEWLAAPELLEASGGYLRLELLAGVGLTPQER